MFILKTAVRTEDYFILKCYASQFCRLASIAITSSLVLRAGDCSTPRAVNTLYIVFIDRVLESILNYLHTYSMEQSPS